MKGSLLVPLDGSEAAEHAIPYAISIARAGHLPIQLLHVLTLDPSVAPADRSYGYDSIVLEDEVGDRVDQAHDYLDRIAELVRKRVTTRVSTAVQFNFPADGIRQCARDAGCALIVMTRHARRGFPKSWMGSVADAVLRSSRLPVLVVPPRSGKPDLDDVPVIHQILIPIDGSELSDELLPVARNIGAATDVHFTLFWVGRATPGEGKRSAQSESDRNDNTRMMTYLLERAASFAPGTVDVVIRCPGPGDVAAAIVKEADEMQADIIGMATHARRPFGRALFGSVADQVLQAGARPVLVYRPVSRAREQIWPRPVSEREANRSVALK